MPHAHPSNNLPVAAFLWQDPKTFTRLSNKLWSIDTVVRAKIIPDKINGAGVIILDS
jgi:hypothetical protein